MLLLDFKTKIPLFVYFVVYFVVTLIRIELSFAGAKQEEVHLETEPYVLEKEPLYTFFFLKELFLTSGNPKLGIFDLQFI